MRTQVLMVGFYLALIGLWSWSLHTHRRAARMRVETARSLAVTAARIRALGGPDLSHQFEIPPQPWYLRLTLWKAICYCGIITNFVLLITVPFRYH